MTKIPFIHTYDFEYGIAEPQSRLVSRITADNPGPFTYTGTGVYIVGTKDVAIIDPGPITPAHTKALDQALAGKTLTHILLTHHHADHSPMAAPLAKKHGCNVYGCPPQDEAVDGASIKLDAGDDLGFAPDIVIKDGDVFTGADWTLETVHTPGHTSNHMCFALRQENTLFSGDHIMGWATSVVIPPGGHMGDYLASLRKVERQNYDIIRPTHGPAITEVAPYIQAYIAHRLEREEQVFRALKDEHITIMDIVAHIYTNIDKRLYPAAAMSVWSHLIHLCENGRAECAGNMNLAGHYSSAL
ncbi:MAG: MBL fold metallo-hydrolase [Robiginitomaculum sp.]|nr:MBL fold metallo-hydrolase [Robiginitomaculum sp.]